MPRCTITAYIEERTQGVSAEVESSCETLYTCSASDKVKSLSGAEIDARDRGCMVLKTKGPYARITMTFSSLSEILPETPVIAHLVHPYPPFSEADVSIVIDSSPDYDIYGLEVRGSSVITSTKRTLLEGRGLVQLVNASEGTIVGEAEIIVDDLLSFETRYPILPRDKHARGIRLCSWKLGIPEPQLIYRHGSPSYVLGYVNYIRTSIRGFEKLRLQAALTKLYEALPMPAEYVRLVAEELSRKKRIEIVEKTKDTIRTVVEVMENIPLRLRHKLGSGVQEILEITVGRHGKRIEDKWDEISVFCRECWEPLRLYELKSLTR